ncbi:hypothetical protein [Actinoplanes sp. NBRC 101535]|nr:hypothetical protein [Actinoplanes sp. NBRC 101535]GLY07987.1 hypothetical protein Acsp01_83660 [Actinoplanes sp. NBRC 101535]
MRGIEELAELLRREGADGFGLTAEQIADVREAWGGPPQFPQVGAGRVFR